MVIILVRLFYVMDDFFNFFLFLWFLLVDRFMIYEVKSDVFKKMLGLEMVVGILNLGIEVGCKSLIILFIVVLNLVCKSLLD